MSACRMLFLLAAASVAAAPLAAQQPQAAIVPEAITVGDVFRAAIRVELPPGAGIAAPDSLVLGEDLESAGRREVRVDTAGGARRVTVVYPLTAWRPGSYDVAPIEILVVADGAESRHTVTLPTFTVGSVLPADTTGIEPREAKDVLGANRLWWPILLALLIAAAVAVALWYWWRRRRRGAADVETFTAPPVAPRTAALEQLEALRRSGLLERGETGEFYERLTETLRHYVATRNRAWGVDLTTTELAQIMVATGGGAATLDLVRILRDGDLVKFARRRVAAADALEDLDAAVAWVERAEPEAQAPGTEGRRVA